MMVVTFYGQFAELAGIREVEIDAPEPITLDELRHEVVGLFPSLGNALFEPQVLSAINQNIASWQSAAKNGDHVALLPPVSGG